MNENKNGLLTLDEAAAYLGVAKITLRRWTRAGQLPCVRVGNRRDRRFRKQDLDAYIADRDIRLPRESRPKEK
jgi:transcriptional repressor of dcmA and dcmR